MTTPRLSPVIPAPSRTRRAPITRGRPSTPTQRNTTEPKPSGSLRIPRSRTKASQASRPRASAPWTSQQRVASSVSSSAPLPCTPRTEEESTGRSWVLTTPRRTPKATHSTPGGALSFSPPCPESQFPVLATNRVMALTLINVDAIRAKVRTPTTATPRPPASSSSSARRLTRIRLRLAGQATASLFMAPTARAGSR